MEDFTWLKELIEEFEQDIRFKKERLEKYKYDEEFVEELKTSISILTKLVDSLKKQIPEDKAFDGGLFRCVSCGCVVDRYNKFCAFCGQRMTNDFNEVQDNDKN